MTDLEQAQRSAMLSEMDTLVERAVNTYLDRTDFDWREWLEPDDLNRYDELERSLTATPTPHQEIDQ